MPTAAGARRPEVPAAFDRTVALERLGDEAFDVLVVGGGITGAGVALDAASRGLRTALVEQADFASGTSSRSSKLVHGGLRYLQQGDVRLVYEALHERQRLLRNAPHLVEPVPFLIPLFGRDGVVRSSVARTYGTALWLYDVTGGIRIGRRHRRVDRAEALEHLPTLQVERLVAGFLYWDARTDDARLTLALLRTAALDHGAVVANYARCTGLVRDARGRIAGARVRSTLRAGRGAEAGSRTTEDDGEIEVRAAAVINATGVWADEVRQLAEEADGASLRPAKGVHVTIPASRLPADIAAVLPAGGGRSIFVVPWPDGADVYLGTTDTAWDGSLEDPACLPEDVDYILTAANRSLSGDLRREDVTGVWAGVRPLLAPGPGQRARERTADLSRRHRVSVSSAGLVTVTGGKLTTYRKMAQDTVDAALGVLGEGRRSAAQRCRTRRLAIRGALVPGAPGPVLEAPGLSPAGAAALRARYGSEAPDVLALADGDTELLAPLVPGLPELKVEALWAASQEMAQTLDDVLERRCRAVLRRAEATATAASAVARLLTPLWGIDADRAAAEAETFSSTVLGSLERAGVPVGAASRQGDDGMGAKR